MIIGGANFVRAARIRTEQLRNELGRTQRSTLAGFTGRVMRTAAKQEKQDLISLIGTVRDKLNINLVWFGPGEADDQLSEQWRAARSGEGPRL